MTDQTTLCEWLDDPRVGRWRRRCCLCGDGPASLGPSRALTLNGAPKSTTKRSEHPRVVLSHSRGAPIRLRDRPRVVGVAVLVRRISGARGFGDVPQPHLPERRHQVTLKRSHIGSPWWRRATARPCRCVRGRQTPDHDQGINPSKSPDKRPLPFTRSLRTWSAQPAAASPIADGRSDPGESGAVLGVLSLADPSPQ